MCNILYDNSFRPLIDKPTRITTTSATLIDNILTNVHASPIQSGIFYNDITDHLPIFQITNLYCEQSTPQIPSPIIHKTDLSSINSMKNDLSSILWDEVLACEDIDNAYSKFIHRFKNAYENKRINKKYKVRKPWITNSLLKCIHKKDRMYKRFCKNKNQSTERKFKNYRNKLNSILKRAKKQYYCNLLQKTQKQFV